MNVDASSSTSERWLSANASRDQVAREVGTLLARFDTSWANDAKVLVAAVGTGSTAEAQLVADVCARTIGRSHPTTQAVVACSAPDVLRALCDESAASQDDYCEARRITLRSCCLPDGIAAAGGWLRPVALVVVGEWHSSILLGHSAVMDSLPVLLDPSRKPPTALLREHIWEAHNLLRPEMCIGLLRETGGPIGIVAGDSDIGVECAVARASGHDPRTLPHLSFLQSRESLGDSCSKEPTSVSARGSILSALRSASTAEADLWRLPRNRERILAAVRRRLHGDSG